MRKIAACTAFCIIVVLPACVHHPRADVSIIDNAKECVVLLHALNRSWWAMRPMANALQDAGYSTANVDYPSQLGRIEEIAPFAVGTGVDECRASGASKIHFVTHSMGGILLRYQQKHSPISDLGRVVMLGPPNQGSEIMDKSRDWFLLGAIGGEAGAQLGTGSDSMPVQLGPVDFELGVIAGTGSINFVASAMLPDPDDGKVSVASTRVEGMDDFLVVGNSHRYIIKNDLVYRNTVAFLQNGKFLDEDKAEMSAPQD